jgi:hypothetical protein
VCLVNSEMRDNAGVDAATLANNWGVGIEADKRNHLVTTQREIIWMIHPSLTNQYKTNDRQLRDHSLPATMFTYTIYSTLISRQQQKAAQIFCTDFGFVRAFPMKLESEAHEALCLLFHRDLVPNVMVMDGAKAHTDSEFTSKLHYEGYQINQTEAHTHKLPTWVKVECAS